MSATFDFDRLLSDVLGADGPLSAPTGAVDAALARARTIRQRRPVTRLLDRLAWPANRFSLGNPVTARIAMVGLLTLLTLALLAAAISVGSRLLRRDEVLPPHWAAVQVRSWSNVRAY